MLPPTHWMERVIRINSETHRSNFELVHFLSPLLKEAGLQVMEQVVREGHTKFSNLIGFSHPHTSTKELLVMNTHLDTVPAGTRRFWTKTGGDPFRLTRSGDRLYGLGAADVKLDFLCKLWAIKNAPSWKVPFALVGTFGEERALNGVSALLKSRKVKARFALVGEPSNLELIYAHKGQMIFECEFPLSQGKAEKVRRYRGKSAHSATPQVGKNAIHLAFEDLRKNRDSLIKMEGGLAANIIPDFCETSSKVGQTKETVLLLDFLKEIFSLQKIWKTDKDTNFSPSYTTLQITKAFTSGGKIYLTFDSRTLPNFDSTRGLKDIDSALKQSGGKRVGFEYAPPLKGSRKGRLLKSAERSLKSLGLRPQIETKATSTEAALYQEHGAEAIVFGPGISVGNVHRPNEHNSIRQMTLATKFYGEMLKGGIDE